MVADVSKCQGTGCPFKSNCLRYTRPAGHNQAWFTVVPYNVDTKSCDFYWPDQSTDKKRKLKKYE
jgi:hypothetical protein